MSSPAARRPGPESTLETVRAKLVAAGMDLLGERGVDIGLSHISLSDAIDRSGVSRSTAYRSLADDELAPQAVLQRDLLQFLLARYSRTDTVERWQVGMQDEFQRQQEHLASHDVAIRTYALRSVVRVTANMSYEHITELPHRAILTAIYGALRSSGRHDWRHELLIDGEDALMSMLCGIYRTVVERFGLQMKQPYTIEHFTSAGASLNEGMAMRHTVNEHVTRMIERPTGLDGEMEEWTLFAVSFEGLIMAMLEPVDSENPFVDLVRY